MKWIDAQDSLKPDRPRTTFQLGKGNGGSVSNHGRAFKGGLFVGIHLSFWRSCILGVAALGLVQCGPGRGTSLPAGPQTEPQAHRQAAASGGVTLMTLTYDGTLTSQQQPPPPQSPGAVRTFSRTITRSRSFGASINGRTDLERYHQVEVRQRPRGQTLTNTSDSYYSIVPVQGGVEERAVETVWDQAWSGRGVVWHTDTTFPDVTVDRFPRPTTLTTPPTSDTVGWQSIDEPLPINYVNHTDATGAYTEDDVHAGGAREHLFANSDGSGGYQYTNGAASASYAVGTPVMVAGGTYAIPLSASGMTGAIPSSVPDWFPGGGLAPTPLTQWQSTVHGPARLPAVCAVDPQFLVAQPVLIEDAVATVDPTLGIYDVTHAFVYEVAGIDVCETSTRIYRQYYATGKTDAFFGPNPGGYYAGYTITAARWLRAIAWAPDVARHPQSARSATSFATPTGFLVRDPFESRGRPDE